MSTILKAVKQRSEVSFQVEKVLVRDSSLWVGGVIKWQLLMIYSTVGGPKEVKNMMT